jgi:hypothetical protein
MRFDRARGRPATSVLGYALMIGGGAGLFLLFAMLVIMAVVTTFATTPLLGLITRTVTEPDAERLRL